MNRCIRRFDGVAKSTNIDAIRRARQRSWRQAKERQIAMYGKIILVVLLFSFVLSCFGLGGKDDGS